MQAQMDFLFQTARSSQSYMPMHTHTCYELVYYDTGTGTTCLQEMTYPYKPGTYALIPADTPHDERRYANTDVIFVGFRLAGEEQEAELEAGLFEDAPDRPIAKLLHEMVREMQEQRPYYSDQLNYLIGMIVIAHQRSLDISISKASADHLLYTRTFIDEHYNQKITVEELAEMAGYSYHHFRHLFKRQYGISPIAYLLRKRVERACQLLLHSKLSVTAIAEACGFSSDAQFSTLFKREQGVSPRQFRQTRSRPLPGGVHV